MLRWDKNVAKQPTKEAVDYVWQNPDTPEAAAKCQGGGAVTHMCSTDVGEVPRDVLKMASREWCWLGCMDTGNIQCGWREEPTDVLAETDSTWSCTTVSSGDGPCWQTSKAY